MTKGIHPPAILAVLPLAYQDGRDCYTGILQYVAAHGLRWNIHLVRNEISRPRLVHELKSDINGIIFSSNTLAAPLVRLIPPGLPCVALDAADPEAFADRAQVAFVDIDSETIGRRGAEYLAAQGNYAAFGIVGYEDCAWSESRIESFRKTLSERGVSCDALLVRRTDLHDTQTHEKMREWVARLHRPAAVMAVCDELGRTLIDALAAGGVRVPQDVAVLGVDNEGILCTHMSPTLSSIQPDFERSGFLAAACMDAFLQRPAKASAPPMRRISPVRGIIGRESTAPASATGRMVLKAEEFIRRHAGENIHVDEVARHLGVSRRLFDLRFREVTGRTALDAIHAEQLESVRHLLRTTSLSITEISRLCNFRSENHLKRLFKQVFGQTMSAYRLAQRVWTKTAIMPS